MPAVLNERVRKPCGTRSAASAKECRQQARMVAAADAADRGLDAFLDAALADVDAAGEA